MVRRRPGGQTWRVDIGGVRLYDRERADPLKPLVAAQRVSVDFLARRVRVEALKIPRLHDGYYKPGNMERNERIDVELPKLPTFDLVLIRPEVLGVAPERVRATVKVKRRRLEVGDIHLEWPDIDRAMSLDGQCTVDFDAQRVAEVSFVARQVRRNASGRRAARLPPRPVREGRGDAGRRDGGLSPPG